jgi:PAS domain S-box-containing protein
MQTEMPAEQTPTPGRGRDTTQRVKLATRSSPADEGDPTEPAERATHPLESERLLRTVFERADVGLALVSLEGRWLRVNPRLGELLGYSHDELATLTCQDLTHPDDREANLVNFQRLLAGKLDTYDTDQRYVRKDGVPVWVHLTASLVRTADGAPDHVIVTAQDITERKAMQALTDSALSSLALDDLLRELLGRVPAVMGVDHVAIFLLEEDGQTLTLRAVSGEEVGAVGQVQLPVGRGVAGRIAASREPVIVDDTFTIDTVFSWLREHLRSVVGVPLLVEDHVEGHPVSRLVGVVLVGSAAPRRFTEADVQLLQHAADRIGLAVGRAHLYAAEQDARRRAEAALARAQASEAQASARAEQLHTILETMTDGVAVTDAEGRYLQTNRAYRELHAADRLPGFEAMLPAERGRLLEVRDPATGAPLPSDRSPVGRALRGEVVAGPDADLRVRAFDGRELVVNASAAPLRDGAGHVVGTVLVVRDLTERKQLAHEHEAARAQAERQADQLDRIFEAAADGLIVWDAERQQVRENAAARRILGMDAAPPGYYQLPVRERLALLAARDEHGRPVAIEEWPIMRALSGDVEARTRAQTRDVRMRALDGREVEVTFSTTPLRDREGHFVGAVSVIHDQTESRRLERERAAAHADELAAREASRRMEQFLATAAHDLRTPLTTTVGFIDLADRQSERLAAAARKEYPALARQIATVRDRLENADQSAARLARLLTLLFDTATIRTDGLELHRAPLDLAALVRQQVEALRVATPSRAIRLHMPMNSAPFPVKADADRIGQVVVNYVTNALKYSPPDQPVDVSVAARGSRARVAVCDRGRGIPAAERARVWELFHRVPGATAQDRTQGGSLGLGLHISKAIVTAHGGRVGVKSVVGEGSTFWFTLPLSAPVSSPIGAAHIGVRM